MPQTKETEEDSFNVARTAKYRELLISKIGSDSYNNRPSQTFNLT